MIVSDKKARLVSAGNTYETLNRAMGLGTAAVYGYSIIEPHHCTRLSHRLFLNNRGSGDLLMDRNETEQARRRIKQTIPWWDLKHRAVRSDLLRRAFQGEDVDAYCSIASGMRNVWADGKRIPLNDYHSQRGGGGDAA